MCDKRTRGESELKIRELNPRTKDDPQITWWGDNNGTRSIAPLDESEDLFRNIFRNSPIGIEVYDKKGRLVLANPACCDIFGIVDMTEIEGFNLFDDPNVSEPVKKALQNGNMSRYEVAFDFEKVKENTLYQTTRSGVSHLDVTIVPIGDPKKRIHGYLVHVQDITEQVKSQTALRDNQNLLRTLIDAIPIPVFYKDRSGRYMGFNRAFEMFFGATEEKLIGKSVFDINPPELAGIYYAKDNELFESGGIQTYESQVKNTHDVIRDVIFNKAVFTDSQGVVTGLVGAILDITERKAAEKALNERVKELNCLFQISNIAQRPDISLDEIIQRVVALIPASYQYPDITSARVILEGKEYKTENFKKTELKQTSEILINGNSKGMLEICCGEEGHPFEGDPFLAEEKHLTKAISEILGRTIERAQMREEQRLLVQLQHANKMEAVATLAGGVAHEFNNALMVIMGTIELLMMDSLIMRSERIKYFESIRLSGDRMSRLTDQLLAYAQGGKYQPRALKLNDFIKDTMSILRHQLNPGVRVETALSKGLSRVHADRTQMQMVLSAILANSNEAIEDEGLIRITAENQNLDEDRAKEHPGLKPGRYICLRIEDNGRGMNEEEKERIFEPFFTTKFQGRGMGMAAVYGIIKNHGGWISVDSEVGKGAAIQVCLPAVEDDVKGGKSVAAHT